MKNKTLALMVFVLVIMLVLPACTRSAPTAAPTQAPSQPKATTAPGATSQKPATPLQPVQVTPPTQPPAVQPTKVVPTAVPPTTVPTQPPAPVVAQPQALPTTVLAVPATYTLQRGEFPYCIARRYNVDPNELLYVNGLRRWQYYYPGWVLRMPTSGVPFPYTRALRAHPASYTVRYYDTWYSIACYYGDVDPAALAAVNGKTLADGLVVGQVLKVP